MYLYSFIGLVKVLGLVNDGPSERINAILYCSLCRIQILAHSSQLMHTFIAVSGSIHALQEYNNKPRLEYKQRDYSQLTLSDTGTHS